MIMQCIIRSEWGTVGLQDTPVFQENNLNVPENYAFLITVKDSELSTICVPFGKNKIVWPTLTVNPIKI